MTSSRTIRLRPHGLTCVIALAVLLGGCWPTIDLPEINPNNRVPAANAGPDKTVCAGSRVTLSAAGSSDPDGDSLSYEWTQTLGPEMALQNAGSISTAFSATTAGLYEFAVTVSDGRGGTDEDSVRVTVLVDCGDDQSCAPVGSPLLSTPTTFDGTNYVNVPDGSSLDFGTNPFEIYVEFTIATGVVPGNRTLVMKGETVLGTGWFIGYGEWDDGSGLKYGLVAQVSNESAGGINLDLRAIAPEIYNGQWHSAALVREAAHAVLYLDCVEVDRVPLQNLGSVSNDAPVTIGRHHQPKGYHVGQMRSVIIRSPL